jgi:hypothetical protein
MMNEIEKTTLFLNDGYPLFNLRKNLLTIKAFVT